MFENKVLVNLYILSLGKNFELYLPVNEKVGNISKLLNTTMFDTIDTSINYSILNIEDGTCYKDNELIRDTNIKTKSSSLRIRMTSLIL